MSFQPRQRNTRIVATLGPASNTKEMVTKLIEAGVDVFRINMSHGSQADKGALIETIREIESEERRPLTILADLQGPKLRVGQFADGPVLLENGATFVFDADPTPGDVTRVHLPHPELFAALEVGQRLMIDDGKVKVEVTEASETRLVTRVLVGGKISNNKGVNVPDAVIPLAALTEKDHSDLQFALQHNVDWIALSFVQRPEDVVEAKRLIDGRAGVLAKIEKPSALKDIEAILDVSDAVMVARGDLGVELPPEEVPAAQKRIVEQARAKGKMVVVATQMLESMIQSPTPTRAEVSDVANAIYDGADAVMLSAESAAGAFPIEAVAMMDAIARQVEADPSYSARMHLTRTDPESTAADALSRAAAQVAQTVSAKLVCCFTSSGSTAIRVSRERPATAILVLTPELKTARRLGIVWGVHSIHTRDVVDFEEMIAKSKRMALRSQLTQGGDRIVVVAGYPFGIAGSTNTLHIAKLTGDELYA
ncbi:MAG: pyruvate kinase [Sphingomonadales bacterium]|nr:MAG: pyruvate kinase [Sphingomonadales bacterium]